jgi:hypothetical protein
MVSGMLAKIMQAIRHPTAEVSAFIPVVYTYEITASGKGYQKSCQRGCIGALPAFWCGCEPKGRPVIRQGVP